MALANFSHEWESIPSESLEAVLRAGAERIGWARTRTPRARPGASQGSKQRGLGFSCHHAWHAAWQEQISGDVQVDGQAQPGPERHPAGAACARPGVGSNTCAVLACAEALGFLGVRPDDVEWIANPDTETGLKDMVQTDSSVSYLQAELMPQVAEQVAARCKQMAAPELEAASRGADIADGRGLRHGRPSRRRDAYARCSGTATWCRCTVTVSQNAPRRRPGVPFVATFAEVEVDTDTGKVEVQRLVVVHDAGTVMFASGAEGQQVGGQCTGIGESLYEEIVYDEATGVPAELQLGRLQHADHARLPRGGARCCSRCGGAPASTAPAASARAPHLHAARHPQRRLQRHRRAHRRDPRSSRRRCWRRWPCRRGGRRRCDSSTTGNAPCHSGPGEAPPQPYAERLSSRSAPTSKPRLRSRSLRDHRAG